MLYMKHQHCYSKRYRSKVIRVLEYHIFFVDYLALNDKLWRDKQSYLVRINLKILIKLQLLMTNLCY